MGAYAHLFGYVEEFIAPTMVTLARDFAIDNRPAFDALTNFAAEEVKHMHLFRELRAASTARSDSLSRFCRAPATSPAPCSARRQARSCCSPPPSSG